MIKPKNMAGLSAMDMRMIKKIAFLGLVFSSFLAQAQNAIQSLTASVQGGVEVLRIDTAEPLSGVPAGFAIQSPARIALDFPGVINAIGRNVIELNHGNEIGRAHV